MKTLFLSIIGTLSFTSALAQEIEVTIDTLNINIRGRSGPAIKFQDNYYLYYNADNSNYSSQPTVNFYIANTLNTSIKQVFVPDDLQQSYYDLYTRNDSIFTTEYWDRNTYFLDKDQWKQTKKSDDIMYEDGAYSVASLDHGEWGGCTWFRNKITKKEYEIGVINPIITIIKDTYYLTTYDGIYQVNDPTRLKQSESRYAPRQQNQKRTKYSSTSFQGVQTIFNNHLTEEQYKYALVTSFVIHEKLYHIYSDSLGTYIGIIENEVMQPIYTFKDKIRLSRWRYHDRYRTSKFGSQSIQFYSSDEKLSGLMEINGQNIKMTYFKNSYKEPVLGTSFAKEQFEKQFQLYYSQLDNLKLGMVESMEKDLSATDLTQRHKMSTSYTSKNVETPRIYSKIEDSTFVIHTLYYYTKDDKAVHVICFDWKKNNLNKSFDLDHEFDFDAQEKIDKINIALFKVKLASIKEYLSQLLGKPVEDKKGPNYTETSWMKDRKIVNLHSNEQSIELNIYSK